jgi:transketolase
MGLEDLAMLRAVPEAVVLYPADGACTDACVQLAAAHPGLVYLRTTRMKTPAIYDADTAFTIGGSKTLRQSGDDVLTIVAAGITLHEALAAHEELHGSGIAVRVIDLYCVKPVDEPALLAAARATRNRVLTVEDHYAEGGIGDAVAAALGPAGVQVERLAVREIPRSGAPKLLLERHGIGRAAITARVKQLVAAPAVAA